MPPLHCLNSTQLDDAPLNSLRSAQPHSTPVFSALPFCPTTLHSALLYSAQPLLSPPLNLVQLRSTPRHSAQLLYSSQLHLDLLTAPVVDPFKRTRSALHTCQANGKHTCSSATCQALGTHHPSSASAQFRAHARHMVSTRLQAHPLSPAHLPGSLKCSQHCAHATNMRSTPVQANLLSKAHLPGTR